MLSSLQTQIRDLVVVGKAKDRFAAGQIGTIAVGDDRASETD